MASRSIDAIPTSSSPGGRFDAPELPQEAPERRRVVEQRLDTNAAVVGDDARSLAASAAPHAIHVTALSSPRSRSPLQVGDVAPRRPSARRSPS